MGRGLDRAFLATSQPEHAADDAGAAAQVPGDLDVAEDRRALEGLQVLERPRGPEGRGHVGLATGDLRAVQDYRSFGGLEDAGDHVERRRLAGAVGADEGEDLARVDVQVEVARALALEPSVLLLDEPMAGLSGAERDALSALLRKVREAGVTVLLVEHDVAAVMALADRVAVLDDGRLISLGTPAEVTSDPAVIAAYLGTDEHDEELVRTAAAHTQGVDDAEPSTSAEGVTT